MLEKHVSGAKQGACPEMVLFTGHSDDVTDLAFSPDGALIASCSYDRSVILWDAHSGHIVRKLDGHGEALKQVAFSPCGALLASLDCDGVRLWDVRTGRLLGFSEDAHLLFGFLPDGKLLAGSSGGNFQLVWLDQHGEIVASKEYPEDKLDFSAVGDAVSPDGRLITINSCSGNDVHLHDAVTGDLLLSLEKPELLPEHGTADIDQLTFSPDSRLVVARCSYAVILWDARSGAYLRTVLTHPYQALEIAFTADATRLAIGTTDGLVELYDLQTWRRLHAFHAHDSWARALAFSPDQTLLATGGCDHIVKTWEVSTGNNLHAGLAHTVTADRVSFSRDGRSIECCYSDGKLRTWDIRAGQLVSLVTAPDPSELPLAVSPDGSTKVIRLRKRFSIGSAVYADSGQRVEAIGDDFSTTAFSPDGKLLCIGEWGFEASLWDVSTWQRAGQFRLFRDSVSSIAFSPDGKTIAVGTDYDPTVQLFSVKTFREKRRLTEHTNRVESIAYSPDGRALATASADGTVRLWNPRNGRLLLTMMLLPCSGGDSCEDWISFTPEGYYNGSSGAERFIRWQMDGEIVPGEVFSGEFRRTCLRGCSPTRLPVRGILT